MAGTGITLSIKVDFDENDIKREINKWTSEVLNPATMAANSAVAAAAKESLQQSIESNVYAKWKPKSYHRTGGIIDDPAITATPGYGMMILEYFPSGESEQWDNPVDDDALIARIEGGNGYEWRRHPGPRPFWKKFVDEMVNGVFAAEFDAAMSSQLGDAYEGGTTVERESGDGDY